MKIIKEIKERIKNSNEDNQEFFTMGYNYYIDLGFETIKEELERYNEDKEDKYTIDDIVEIYDGKWGSFDIEFEDGEILNITPDAPDVDNKWADSGVELN